MNANCDALSRLPVNDDTEVIDTNFLNINYFEEGTAIFDSKMLEKESKKDKTISAVIRYTVSEWPDFNELATEEKPYHKKRFELAVESGCLFWGMLACIPESMQVPLLKEFHASHLGIVKIKMYARSYVWWPGIDGMIEELVKDCKICSVERKKPANTPLTTWPWPNRAWSRIHCDFAGPFFGNMYLIVMDAHSKWPEVINFKKNTKAYRLVEVLIELFTRHGLPLHCVTDGGPQFRSEEFCSFLKRHGVAHTFSPPYHPETNGAAENFVQTFKDKVTKIVNGGEGLDAAINRFLFDYRSMIHCTTGASPAYLMYKRELRTRFDLLKPSRLSTVEKRQKAQITARPGNRKESLEVGDAVLLDNFAAREDKRVSGTVIKKTEPCTYQVKTNEGAVHKRHIDQLIKRVNTPGIRRSPRLLYRTRLLYRVWCMGASARA